MLLTLSTNLRLSMPARESVRLTDRRAAPMGSLFGFLAAAATKWVQ